MITLRRAIVVPLLVCAAAFAFIACSGDEAETDSSAAQGDVAAIGDRIERNEIMFALVEIGSIPLHDMNEAIAEGRIESDFIPDTRKALRLLALTDWGSLQAQADELTTSGSLLLAALRDNDVEAAKEPAASLHEGWHDFSVAAWEDVEKGSPVLTNNEDDDHGAPTTTEAGTTPDASAPGDH
jgi:hypothetical protein